MKLQITKSMSNALTAMSEGAFQQAGSLLSDAKNAIREAMQQETSPKILKIINELENQKDLSMADMEILRTWIIGDAISYTKMENNFQTWIDDFKRLEAVLRSYEDRDCSGEDLVKLDGILEDAIRNSYDIANFLEKQERVKKFEAAIAGPLGREERKLLVTVLKTKLQSDRS